MTSVQSRVTGEVIEIEDDGALTLIDAGIYDAVEKAQPKVPQKPAPKKPSDKPTKVEPMTTEDMPTVQPKKVA